MWQYEVINFLIWFFNYFIFFYCLLVVGSYSIMAAVAAREMVYYKRKNSYTDYKVLLSSPLAPGISIIAPAYNEAKNIVDNIRSLLSMYYNNYEVIIVNDGSKDDTLVKMVEAYQLVKVDVAIHQHVNTKNIRGVYKSVNKAYQKLVVIDKENGGKADALNAGINMASKELVAMIDVDCVMEQTALLKMAKPFLEHTGRKVIATGAVVRIANGCVIEDGHLVKASVPTAFFPRIQILEYFRSFLMGRMAWSSLDGLLIISGALGLYDRGVVIAAGGCNHNTVGEDMELVVRMRRYMRDTNQKYRVVYIPDPLCWTEAPNDARVLGRQRNRWMRGTIETLWIHRKLFFNPKYGILGMLAYPYWFFFEMIAPIIEFLGIVFFIFVAIMGYANWEFFFTLCGMIYGYAIMLSFFSLAYEEYSYRQYPAWSDLFKLMGACLLEPIFFHPRTVVWSLRGHLDVIRGRKSWGDMSRAGLSNSGGASKKKVAAKEPVAQVAGAPVVVQAG